MLNVSCSGRSFMVTGGNSGIGKATAMEIAKRGEVKYISLPQETSSSSRGSA